MTGVEARVGAARLLLLVQIEQLERLDVVLELRDAAKTDMMIASTCRARVIIERMRRCFVLALSWWDGRRLNETVAIVLAGGAADAAAGGDLLFGLALGY